MREILFRGKDFSGCIENKGISGALLDIAEAIDGVIKDESEDDTE